RSRSRCAASSRSFAFLIGRSWLDFWPLTARRRRLAPVGPIDGNNLVRTFWGKAWCDNLESYVDYANRLPRGGSYARHGATADDRGMRCDGALPSRAWA